jgi:hypothetical protein
MLVTFWMYCLLLRTVALPFAIYHSDLGEILIQLVTAVRRLIHADLSLWAGAYDTLGGGGS